MKSHTDLDQSKKLAKILPIESADMFLAIDGTLPVMSKYIIDGLVTADETAIPCWSLAALLDVLPKNLNIGRPSLDSNYKGYYWLQYYDEFMKPNNYKTKCFNNSVDACYEMIVKLKERNLI